MKLDAYIKQIRERIAGGQFKAALSLLRAMLEHTPHLNEAIQQSARYADICRQVRLGKTGQDAAAVALNQLRWDVLELLSQLEAQQNSVALEELLEEVQTLSLHPEWQREAENAVLIANSQNVVLQSELHAGGNIHIVTNIYGEQKQQSAPAGPHYEFNKRLVPLLIKAMASYNEKADRLSRDLSWLNLPEDFNRVQKFVFQSFIGELGKQLRDLVRIDVFKEMTIEEKQRYYIDKILDIAPRTFDLLNYALLSAWWDYVKVTPLALHPRQRDKLAACFDKNFEYNLEQQFQLLRTLVELFREHAVPFPFQELPDAADQMAENGELHQACRAWQNLSKKNYTPADCDQAESLLGTVMSPFGFLTLYRMVSIKKIHYRQMHHDDARYMHRFVALGLDNKHSEDAEKLNYCELSEHTPAVLLYRGDNYQNGLNLFPFIIDYNALMLEPGAKLCFFSATDLNDGALQYRFLGDNRIIRIEKTGICKPETDLNELLLQLDNLKLFNLDCVVDAFMDARRTISGDVNIINLNEL
ncbi:MAG: hypothetical protein JNK77_00165 [Saprospiraceae bacterium]|nr:hypothetical protein [Saprospiraceae bacterium]